MPGDFDPRDYGDPRDESDFDIYNARWLDQRRDPHDRVRDVDGDSRPEGPRPARSVCRGPRELQHDSALFGAHLALEERLRDQGAEIERVVLKVDIRREYQEWLQHNTGNPASDGRH